MSTDGYADVFQKPGVPYSLSVDTYSGTYIGSAVPTVETASVVHFPIANGIPAALITGANLLQKTQLFDNAYWTKVRSTVTANAILAPDGTLTADKLVEDSTATQTHNINSTNVAGVTPLVNYIWSIYAKAGERNRMRLRAGYDAGFIADIIADLLNGSLLLISGVAGGVGGVIPAGDGWYRIWLRAVMNPAAVSATHQVWLVDTGTNGTYTGNGTSGLYLWGAQLEQSDILHGYTAVA